MSVLVLQLMNLFRILIGEDFTLWGINDFKLITDWKLAIIDVNFWIALAVYGLLAYAVIFMFLILPFKLLRKITHTSKRYLK